MEPQGRLAPPETWATMIDRISREPIPFLGGRAIAARITKLIDACYVVTLESAAWSLSGRD